jgi:hypothetical protein
MFTDEQLQALLSMGDITEAQAARENQLRLAQQLRQAGAQTTGKDIGSNIARAAYGIGGALGSYKGMQAGEGITSMRRALLEAMLKKKQPGGINYPIYGEEGE